MSDGLSDIAWYYGDNDFIIRTFNFMARSDTRMSLVVPDTASFMTCSTDTASCVTHSKNMAFYKLHAAARLPH